MPFTNDARRAVHRPAGHVGRMLDDEELASRVAAGDDAALGELYARHSLRLYRYCRSIVHDESDAQDAVQSAWVKALIALEGRNRDAPLSPWLYRICHNEAVSLLRRRLPLEGMGDDVRWVASAEQAAVDRERFAAVMRDLHLLPERTRSALVMRELGGLSHEEIAAAQQTSVGAAKQSILEARRGLSDLAAGREAACADICQTISDGDRRVLRGRRVRAHLADCASCAGFAASIAERRSALRAVVPAFLPSLARTILQRVRHAWSRPATTAAASTGSSAGAATVAVTTGKSLSLIAMSKALVSAALVGASAWGGIASTVDRRPSAFDARPALDTRRRPGLGTRDDPISSSNLSNGGTGHTTHARLVVIESPVGKASARACHR